MARKLFMAVALCCGICSTAIYAQEQKISYNVSVFNSYSSLPASRDAIEKTRKAVAREFPGWAVVTDKLSGSFTDIHGAPIQLTGATNKDRATACMTGQLQGFGINADEWQLVSAPSATKADYVNYSQSIDGHSVVYARLSFRFTKDGDLARILMKNYGKPAAGLVPSISKEDALKLAVKGTEGAEIASSRVVGDWVWFPVPTAGGYQLRPAWQFVIKGRVPDVMPLKLTGYVDAISGELLYRTNGMKDVGFDLTVKGSVYKNGTTSLATVEPLPNIQVNAGLSVHYADTSGNYTDALLFTPVTAGVPLAGEWSIVVDSPSATIPLFSTLVPGVPTIYTYPASAPSGSRHVNAYYHTTRAHNFMKRFFPAFLGLDFPMRTNIEVPGIGTCNAFAGDSSINFLPSGPGCNAFAELGDIVTHEYGHEINAAFYFDLTGMPMENSALHEGHADVWALSVTRKPILSENAFVGGGFIRRYDMTPQVYPVDMTDATSSFLDPHKTGQIIAGSWWDVGVNIGSVDTMTSLFTDVYYDAPDGPDGFEGPIFQEILVDALMADDNDANLFNGTPHYAQIVAAFAKHGIHLQGDAVFNHNELAHAPAGSPITVSAVLTLTSMSYFHDLTLYYRVNGAGSWNPVAMTMAGSSATATIPSQVSGTVVEYYFVVHDMLNYPSVYLPFTCNSALPGHQVTIPYQFGVGIGSVDSNSFETPVATGYSIALNPGDDAMSGVWNITMPIGLLPMDHTLAGTRCLSAGSVSMGMRGTSTVISPVFNISAYSTPVIEYYRYFSNAGGFSNFKSDPWQVTMKDMTAGTTYEIERTYQADESWRRRIFPVKAFAPTATQVQLKFYASDSVLSTWYQNGQSKTAFGVDDIIIYDKKAPNGIADVKPQRCQVYPNPTNEQLQVSLPTATSGQMSLWDLNGRKITELPITDGEQQYAFDTRKMAEGAYFLLVETPASTETRKIVVMHSR